MSRKTIGFPISHKENENRRALIPQFINNIENPEYLYFEKGYGNNLGISDSEYISAGCKVVEREEVLRQDIICDPKIGDAEYLNSLCRGQSIFGWVHATQNYDITESILQAGLTAYAWENMYYKGRHVFWRNNELAGEAAIMHAFQCYGKMPYETNVAVLGRGNTARGAIKILNMLGAKITQYDRQTESLLREEVGKYDVIVNCILWDTKRKDHIIYRTDLRKMKPNAMIIDVSCDKSGGIESSVPTTIDNPTYIIDGVLHYAVDHTPSLFYKTFSINNSKLITPYINKLVKCENDEVLEKSIVICDGVIVDQSIIDFQNR